MDLKEQVCSLELAKRLKELGVKQESVFKWERPTTGGWHVIYGPQWKEHVFAAFTVAELGEMLPSTCSSDRLGNGTWRCVESGLKTHTQYEKADTEADARAKMLIYLLENDLLTQMK